MSQDIIIKVNGEKIKAKVIEIIDSLIKYKPSGNLEGPIRNIKTGEVIMIKYANGQEELFKPRTVSIAKIMDTSAVQKNAITQKLSETPDTSTFALIYVYLNWFDAQNYQFNLFLNDVSVMKIFNRTRLVYKIYSEGNVTVSDKKHKPFLTLNIKHGGNYYIRLRKYGTGRYFNICEINFPGEIPEYLEGFNAKYICNDYHFTESKETPIIRKL